MKKKKYFIIPTNTTEVFDVVLPLADGTCIGKDCKGNDVILYDKFVEYLDKANEVIYKPYHLYDAYEIPYEEPATISGLNPYQYIHAGEIRDKRARSMCARPYFPR